MPTPAPCPGPCNNAWRRAENLREEDGTEHHLTPAWGQPTQCDGCGSRARQQLTELPELLAAAHLEALHGTRPRNVATIHSRPADNPAFPGQAARLLVDSIVGEMEELAHDVLVLRRIRTSDTPEHTGRREGQRITTTARTLAAHLDWMMQHHPAARESHDRDNANPAGQIRHWHGAAQRFIRAHEQRDVEKMAPCPRCHGPYLAESRDLRLVDDRPYIECRDPDCRRILTTAEYERYVKELAQAVSRAA